MSHVTSHTFLPALLEKINATLRKNPTCRIGLSGGTSPRALYAQLAQQRLPWNRIEWILIDERYVPPTSDQSNFRMLNETLFSQIPFQPENIYVFNTTLPIPEAIKYSQERLQNLTKARHPLIDILILGMGKDGHIASLFPGSPALETSSMVASSQTKNSPVEQRLTLTFNALLDSEEVLILAPGEEKKKALEKAQKPGADFHEFQIAKILQNAKCEIF